MATLAYPPGYPVPGPTPGARLRASDADRDITVDILCAAVGDGRLTLAELEERAGAALSARTLAELAALIADLPGTPRATGRASPARGPEPADGTGDRSRSGEMLRPGKAGNRPGLSALSRWSVIQSFADACALTGPIGSLA